MLSLLAHTQQCDVVYAQGPVPPEPPESPPEPPEPSEPAFGTTGPDIYGVGVAVGGSSLGGGGSSFADDGLFVGVGVGFCRTLIFMVVPGTIFAPAGGSVATT